MNYNVDKGELKPFFIDEDYTRELDDEEKERNEIIKSGKKKVVSLDYYTDNCYIGDCKICMNYDYENETCKLNVPDEEDECEKWDCIYITEDEV